MNSFAATSLAEQRRRLAESCVAQAGAAASAEERTRLLDLAAWWLDRAERAEAERKADLPDGEGDD